MTRQIEDVSSIQKRIRYEVEADTVGREISKAYDELRRMRRIPGFRPGKAPRRVLEAKFGPQVRASVSQQLIQGAWEEVIEGLDIVGRPTVEPEELEQNGAFSFTVTVDVKPEIALGEYTGLEVEQPKLTVAEEQIEGAIQARLQQAAKVVEIDDRPIVEGDIVVTQLKLAAGDEIVVEEEGTAVLVGQDPYYPGVDALLVGMSKDEEKSDTVTIGDSAVQETLRGRELTADIKVINIQATVVPELDDETAKELGFEDGADAMRESITADATKRIEEGSRNQARANLLQKLIEVHDFEVPEPMIEAQLQQLVQELRMQQMYQGADPRTIHFDEAQMEDLRGRALFAVKGGLLLQGISTAESIDPDESDIDGTLQEIADSQGQTLEFIKAYFQNQGQLDELRHHVREKKTLDWLLDRAKVTEVDPTEAEASDSDE